MKEIITSSSMATFLGCPRKYFYSYELGLKHVSPSTALKLGSAMHKGLEERANCKDFEACYLAAISTGSLTEYEAATIYGLLGGYFRHYGDKDNLISEMVPEQEFRHDIPGSRTFDQSGKIDGIAVVNGEYVIVEHKTTGESIEPSSDYWERLIFNPQLLTYKGGAKALGYDIEKVIYDVIRKPSIAPRSEVPVLDADGLKQVNDANGARVFKKDGTPKQTADKAKGEYLVVAAETPEQFGDRLLADTETRPEFYFARKEVLITDEMAEEFDVQRRGVCKALLHFKAEARRSARPDRAWPRNCTGFSCPMCDYKGFCLEGIPVDPENLPADFKIGTPHQELSSNR